MGNNTKMDEEELKKRLTEEEYHVLRKGDTEIAFTGEYVDKKDDGMYYCKACGAPLFSSKDKFDSGSGWPSFVKAIQEIAVNLLPDKSALPARQADDIERTEVRCARCSSHLGHVFDDGPETRGGKRYCINSAALDFKES